MNVEGGAKVLPYHVCQHPSCWHQLWVWRGSLKSRERLRCRAFQGALWKACWKHFNLLSAFTHQGNIISLFFLHLQRKKKNQKMLKQSKGTTFGDSCFGDEWVHCSHTNLYCSCAGCLPAALFTFFCPETRRCLCKHGLWTSIKLYQVTWKLTFQFLLHSGMAVLSNLFWRTS